MSTLAGVRPSLGVSLWLDEFVYRVVHAIWTQRRENWLERGAVRFIRKSRLSDELSDFFLIRTTKTPYLSSILE